MAWPKGRSRRATYSQREIRPIINDEIESGRRVRVREKSKEGHVLNDERGEVEGDAQDMSISVKEPIYNGVNVNHPSIVSTIKNMVKQGARREDIVKVTGMPREIIEKYQR